MYWPPDHHQTVRPLGVRRRSKTKPKPRYNNTDQAYRAGFQGFKEGTLFLVIDGPAASTDLPDVLPDMPTGEMDVSNSMIP